ncbi:hypothetical protein AMJ52_04590 [candidate division TA06 bacterium DG_78]|uniref:Radical SAM core domain-containing protein n=1 Tax=candidate division TA06 bacterium DG_78 TaxID=1703772 RepID=A0A0S7YDR4_UNCT6|nr:MAG: hypothetical protein AMJ52_04590 [candidate division TA06 bacterium DG_78]
MTTQTNTTLLFKTMSNGEYIYDDNSGAIFPVNELLKKAIDLYPKYDIDTVRAKLIKEYPETYVNGALKFIERWCQTYGRFCSSPRGKNGLLQNVESFKTEDIIEQFLHYPTMAKQLILNLTEDCNLRCKYCIYSDNYTYSRKPSKNAMKLETGKRAIDYFFKLNEKAAIRNPGKKIAISFYGGEPLLCLSIMDKLIQYARENTPLRINFVMTSNGMLLNDEVSDFIVKNNIFFAISLDGNKENHDRNRVTVTGRGSFDIVNKNIKRFFERHPDYLTQMGFICVYDWNTDLEAVERFFEENHWNVMFADPVAPGGQVDNYYDRFTKSERERFFKQEIHMLKRFKNDLENKKDPALFSKVYFAPRFIPLYLHMRAFDKRMNIIPFTVTCLPGTKINVRVDGTFDICERVNPTMPIGDVKNGLDWHVIANLIRKYNNALGDKCLSCPITKICDVCFGDGNAMQNASFLIPVDRCKSLLKYRLGNLSLFYSLLEIDPDAAINWLGQWFKKPEREYFF